MAFASATDVAELWAKELTDAEATMVERRLEQVERLILRRIPDAAERAEDPGYLADLVDIEAEAVLRVVRNPDGYSAESDGQYSYELNGEVASGKLEILPHEWEILGWRASTMFSLVPSFPAGPAPTAHPFTSGG